MELKWAKPEYKHFLVVRLGGLHTALKFLEVIGKHMKLSGLEEVWIESNLLGVKTELRKPSLRYLNFEVRSISKLSSGTALP